MLDLLRAYPLASVVTHDDAGLDANPVVLLADADASGTPHHLRGHVARANSLWQRAGEHGCEILALFHGAQAYVSPSAHPRKSVDGKVVPTWNYSVVQVAGRLRAVHDARWLRALVGELTERHEASRTPRWSVDDAPANYLQAMLEGIVGIEIEVERVTAKFKLSQNHPAHAREALAHELLRGNEASQQVATQMLRPPGGSG